MSEKLDHQPERRSLDSQTSGAGDAIHNPAKPYWEHQYTTRFIQHSEQNGCIAKDFLSHIGPAENPVFHGLFQQVDSLLEFGCGTGEFLQLIVTKYPSVTRAVGIDIAEAAIRFAKTNYQHPKIEYRCYDALSRENGFRDLGGFDLIVSANTLEHFKNPYPVIDKMLASAKYCLIIVPYKQPCTDGYDHEGGAGHVFTFDEQSCSKYDIISEFKLITKGWTHSSCGEIPQKWVVLLGNHKEDSR